MKYPFIKLDKISVFERFGNLSWDHIAKDMDKWPAGTKGYVAITRQGKLKSHEQLGYYYALILPTILKSFEANGDFSLCLEFKDKKVEVELTLKNVDNFLKLRHAAMTGVYIDKTDMTMGECSAFEDWCIKWSATWLGCQIPPSNPNWQDKTPVE